MNSEAIQDSSEEQKRKFLTGLTNKDVFDSIVAEYFVNGATALKGAPISPEIERLTLCVLVLKNRRVVTGSCFCPDEGDYDIEKSQGIARHSAIRKIWPILETEVSGHIANA